MSTNIIMHAVAILFAAYLSAGASELRLAWDASPSTIVTNHILYASTNTMDATNFHEVALVRLAVGTNLTATVDWIKSGRWYFAATAVGPYGIESDLSNVLTVEIPIPPANMRTVVVQYSGTLTNWYDVGFFRLRLP